MDVCNHLLGIESLLWIDWREWIKKSFILARGNESALDAKLLHRPGESETVHEHTDRADDARRIDIDAVGGDRHVIAARGANVIDHDVQRNFRMQAAQTTDLAIDLACLHGAAARAVDANDDARGVRILERLLQAGVDALSTGRRIVRDDAVQLHERRVPAGDRLVFAADPPERYEQEREQIDEAQHLEKDAPVTRAPLLIEHRAH